MFAAGRIRVGVGSNAALYSRQRGLAKSGSIGGNHLFTPKAQQWLLNLVLAIRRSSGGRNMSPSLDR